MTKFLLLLVYFERPNIVRNALTSIRDLKSDNWELVIVDDGSTKPIDPVVQEILEPYMHKVKIIHSGHSIEQKHAQGGSFMGKFMNQAMDESDAELVMPICDDDAVVDNALINLSAWFEANPQRMYGHSFVIPYDPMSQNIGPHLAITAYAHNHTYALQPACNVDSSQVVFRKVCHDRDGIHYPHPQTACLDAAVFGQLYAKYGESYYTGCYAQFKGVFSDQMGSRGERMYTPRDK